MFLIEKFISLSLLSPLPIIIILLFVGVGNLFKKRKKSGLVLILISIFLYLASSEVFIDKKLYDLENSYSIISEKNLEKGEVYVLLGGGIITTTGEGNIPGIMPAVRIMKTAEYYKKYPKKIYISGGSPLQNQESESSVYARELISLGVNSEDIIVEENSKNTNEKLPVQPNWPIHLRPRQLPVYRYLLPPDVTYPSIYRRLSPATTHKDHFYAVL